MSATPLFYQGTDNLEVMADAHNYNAFLLQLIARHARKGDKIVDFGAGIGVFAAEMTTRGFDVVAIEPDPLQRRRIEAQGIASVEDVARLGDEAVDFVYSLNVLEHIEDDDTAIAQIYRVLKPGGRVLIYVPAFQILFGDMDRRVGHYRRYRRGPLKTQFERAGFDIHEACYADSLGFFAAIINNLLGDESGQIDAGAVRLYDRIAFPVSRRLDHLARRFIGKNVVIAAVKPEKQDEARPPIPGRPSITGRTPIAA